MTMHCCKNDLIAFNCAHFADMCVKIRSNDPDQASSHHAISRVSNLDLAFLYYESFGTPRSQWLVTKRHGAIH